MSRYKVTIYLDDPHTLEQHAGHIVRVLRRGLTRGTLRNKQKQIIGSYKLKTLEKTHAPDPQNQDV
jgi:hypothetical protein